MVSKVERVEDFEREFKIRKNEDEFAKGTKFGFRTFKTLRKSDRVNKRTERTLIDKKLSPVCESILARNAPVFEKEESIKDQKKQNRKRVLKNKSLNIVEDVEDSEEEQIKTIDRSDLKSFNQIIEHSNKSERRQVYNLTKTLMHQGGKLCIKSKTLEKKANKPRKENFKLDLD